MAEPDRRFPTAPTMSLPSIAVLTPTTEGSVSFTLAVFLDLCLTPMVG